MWETIKQILRKNAGACIIVEDGQPVFVVTTFSSFQKDLGEPKEKFICQETPVSDEEELLTKINQEITDWKARQSENNPEVTDLEEDDLKIEDLPLV
ncbi:MAG: hypothetical protein PHW33_01985 [Candidatus Portnoybacteria bacterium]|jgi:hypothetical protein|nr:hypothetical protein [Candidatus Portnoybacteria bacterium]